MIDNLKAGLIEKWALGKQTSKPIKEADINKPIVILTEALVDMHQGNCGPSLIMSITSSNLKD